MRYFLFLHNSLCLRSNLLQKFLNNLLLDNSYRSYIKNVSLPPIWTPSKLILSFYDNRKPNQLLQSIIKSRDIQTKEKRLEIRFNSYEKTKNFLPCEKNNSPSSSYVLFLNFIFTSLSSYFPFNMCKNGWSLVFLDSYSLTLNQNVLLCTKKFIMNR